MSGNYMLRGPKRSVIEVVAPKEEEEEEVVRRAKQFLCHSPRHFFFVSSGKATGP